MRPVSSREHLATKSRNHDFSDLGHRVGAGGAACFDGYVNAADYACLTNFHALVAEPNGASEKSIGDLSLAETVAATVTGTCEKGLVVDVNGTRGYICRAELADSGPQTRPEQFHPGDTVLAAIYHVDQDAGYVLLSVRDWARSQHQLVAEAKDRREIPATVETGPNRVEPDPRHSSPRGEAAELTEFERLCEARYPIGQVVTGTVTEVGMHGATVDLGDVQGLVPVRYLAWHVVEDPGDVVTVGASIRAEVVEIDWDWPRLVLSMKHQNDGPWVEFVAQHPVGTVLTGRVFRIRDDGVMVDFGQLVEFLPNWELAWHPVLHPHDVLSIGDETQVRIMAVDRELRRIRTSRRQVDRRIWTEAVARNQPGTTVTGTVVSVSDDFALLEVDGVRGDVHVGELTWAATRSAHDTAAVGDRLRARVLRVCAEEHKLELSVKQLDLTPWQKFVQQHPVGSDVDGIVQSISDMHATVDVQGVRGMIPIGEMAWHPVNAIGEVLEVGDAVQAKVVEFNHDRKSVDLSLRLMDLSMWVEYRQRYAVGDAVVARVKYFTKFGAVLDIGGMKGLLSVNDMDWAPASDPTKYVAVDQELRVRILNFDEAQHRVYVGLRQLDVAPWERFQSRHPVGSMVTGRVVAIQKCNVIVAVDGLKGVVPLGQLSWRPMADPAEIVSIGQSLPLQVLAFNQSHHRITLSRKHLEREAWGAAAAQFVPGARVSGTVTHIANGEVMVNLGTVEGRIPIAELAWRRVKHPREVAAVGDELQLVVLGVSAARKCVTLSLRHTDMTSWNEFVDQHPVGSVAPAKIIDLTRYGAFVELDGVAALVHNKDLSWDRTSANATKLRIGDSVRVKVLRIDSTAHQIAAGIKQCESDPWAGIARRYSCGQHVVGTVTNAMHYGFFVELEWGVVGLLHVSKMPHGEPATTVSTAIDVGQQIEVEIAAVDEARRRISLTQEFTKTESSCPEAQTI